MSAGGVCAFGGVGVGVGGAAAVEMGLLGEFLAVSCLVEWRIMHIVALCFGRRPTGLLGFDRLDISKTS